MYFWICYGKEISLIKLDAFFLFMLLSQSFLCNVRTFAPHMLHVPQLIFPYNVFKNMAYTLYPTRMDIMQIFLSKWVAKLLQMKSLWSITACWGDSSLWKTIWSPSKCFSRYFAHIYHTLSINEFRNHNIFLLIPYLPILIKFVTQILQVNVA